MTPTATTTDPPLMLATPIPLAVVIRRDQNGPELTREAVRSSDLTFAKSEFMREAYFRRGHPEASVDTQPFVVQPVVKTKSDPRCTGFNLLSSGPDGKLCSLFFQCVSVELVASRARQRLLAEGVLGPEQNYFYELVHTPETEPAQREVVPADAPSITVKCAPLKFLRLPLEPLLAHAETVGNADGMDWFPVIYTRRALAKAERFSRRGAEQRPPVESGCALLGSPSSCPKSGEFFIVVHDAIEAAGTQETKFSMTYTGTSWHRIQTLVRARQTAQPASAIRLVGQAHGHPFLPVDVNKNCAECEQRLTCTATSCFASSDDRLWQACVFAKQPWALCHVFGLTARSEPANALFTQSNGCLLQRPYFVIPDFDPESAVNSHDPV